MASHVETKAPSTDLLKEKRIARAIEQLKSRPYMACTKVYVQSGPRHLTYSRRDDVVAELALHLDNLNDPAQELLAATDELGKHFTLTDKLAIIQSSLPEQVRQNLSYQETTINELKAAVSRVGQFLLEQAKTQSEHFDKKQAEFDQRFQSRQDKQQAEYDQKRTELVSREEELNKKFAQFDQRESKLVRRSLLTQILEMIEKQKQVELSLKTSRKRYAVHAIFGIFLLGMVSLAWVFARRIIASEAADWHNFVPLSAGTLGFVGTMIYYIRWNDQWFREHAQAEFRNMRFSADILRASWIAELLFEWERERKGEPLPPEVIASFTQNLFRDERIPGTHHPAESLGSALAQIKGVDISPGSIKIAMQEAAKSRPKTP